MLRIFVTNGTELDVLGIFGIAEAEFGSLVEDICHLAQYFWLSIRLRISKLVLGDVRSTSSA